MTAVRQLQVWVTCFRFHVVQTKNDSTKMAAGTRQTDVFAQPRHADEIAVCLQRTYNTVLLPNSETILCPCGAAQPKTHRNFGNAEEKTLLVAGAILTRWGLQAGKRRRSTCTVQELAQRLEVGRTLSTVTADHTTRVGPKTKCPGGTSISNLRILGRANLEEEGGARGPREKRRGRERRHLKTRKNGRGDRHWKTRKNGRGDRHWKTRRNDRGD
ncbi:hypothetical protein NDU88_004033 [Pleurodeles waltl]|uniref:Uncharacterized protein n=1 Tax=Pleurodeles waltl TaxID=8319 RepID=A0AAV7WUD9_PLEWA|nr:hypothetical protein NDU88_004033 [Pleurodeles waltl]